MAHKCFISFKMEDEDYKDAIRELPNIDMIDKCLNEEIDSDDEDYIMRKIRKENLSDSTVTIFLIGANSSENLGYEEQRFIKRELQASLYHREGNTRSGILGVVLPSMYDSIYKGSRDCWTCGKSHSTVDITDATAIKEFSRNYYLDKGNACAYSEDHRYCILVKWDDFKKNPNDYIDKAYNKRSHPIAQKVVVRPK